MTCTECRDLLPLHLYGDLSDIALTEHLATCAACRAELAALGRTRAALDAVPVPAVSVDLNRIFQFDAERQRRAAPLAIRGAHRYRGGRADPRLAVGHSRRWPATHGALGIARTGSRTAAANGDRSNADRVFA